MGEVKRWECAGEYLPRECPRGPCVDYLDYARLERERDEYKSVADSMGRDAVEFSAKLAEAQAELTRLRAVEAAAKNAIEDGVAGRDPDGKRYYMVPVDSMRELAEACGRKG
jgi:hypothetical protein